MFMEAFIPITLFLVTGAIIITALFIRLQKRKVESQEILAAIEKGVEVKFPERKGGRLLPGLIWLFAGIVMTLAMAVMIPTDMPDTPTGIWIWGLVPVAVGASYLIVHRLEGQAEEDSPKD